MAYFIRLPIGALVISTIVFLSLLLPFRRVPRYRRWWFGMLVLGLC